MSATQLLASFAERATVDDLDAEVRQRIRAHVKDCLGVALAAAPDVPSTALGGLIAMEAGRAEGAYVIGVRQRAAPWDAAWVNGSLSHMLDFDDYGFGHPTACILPAALAVGERSAVRGLDLMLAMAVGWEVFARVSKACRAHERAMRHKGMHPTGIYGPPAAAAAVGKVLGLDAGQLAIAIGLAASSSGGITEQFGTPGKGVQAGNAARAGVVAGMLASGGYRGIETALEGERGLLSVFAGHGNYDVDALSDGLGSGWAIEDEGWGIKLYPACGGALRGIEAALRLRDALVDDPRHIDRIEVDATENLLDSLHVDRPTTGFEGKFSLRYCIAVALADGDVTVESFSERSLQRPLVQELMDRIEVNVLPGGGSGQALFRTPLTLRLLDGSTDRVDVELPRGHALSRLTYDEVSEKFSAATRRRGSVDAVDRLGETIDALEEVTVRELVAAIEAVER